MRLATISLGWEHADRAASACTQARTVKTHQPNTIQGLLWENYRNGEIFVSRSIWNGRVSDPKTRSGRAAVPVIRQLRIALNCIGSGLAILRVGQCSRMQPETRERLTAWSIA
jgi:hypothetical protein